MSALEYESATDSHLRRYFKRPPNQRQMQHSVFLSIIEKHRNAWDLAMALLDRQRMECAMFSTILENEANRSRSPTRLNRPQSSSSTARRIVVPAPPPPRGRRSCGCLGDEVCNLCSDYPPRQELMARHANNDQRAVAMALAMYESNRASPGKARPNSGRRIILLPEIFDGRLPWSADLSLARAEYFRRRPPSAQLHPSRDHLFTKDGDDDDEDDNIDDDDDDEPDVPTPPKRQKGIKKRSPSRSRSPPRREPEDIDAKLKKLKRKLDRREAERNRLEAEEERLRQQRQLSKSPRAPAKRYGADGRPSSSQDDALRGSTQAPGRPPVSSRPPSAAANRRPSTRMDEDDPTYWVGGRSRPGSARPGSGRPVSRPSSAVRPPSGGKRRPSTVGEGEVVKLPRQRRRSSSGGPRRGSLQAKPVKPVNPRLSKLRQFNEAQRRKQALDPEAEAARKRAVIAFNAAMNDKRSPEDQRRHDASITIQKWFLGSAMRRYLAFCHEACSIIQFFFREYLKRKGALKGIMLLQRVGRGLKLRRRANGALRRWRLWNEFNDGRRGLAKQFSTEWFKLVDRFTGTLQLEHEERKARQAIEADYDEHPVPDVSATESPKAPKGGATPAPPKGVRPAGSAQPPKKSTTATK